MQSAYPALVERLADDTQITALVADRIYAFIGDEDSPYPDIVVIPTVKTETKDITGTVPPYFERISIECRGKTARDADLVGVAVRQCLQNAVFRYTYDTGSSINVSGCIVAGDVFPVDEEFVIFRRIVDFRVIYTPG